VSHPKNSGLFVFLRIASFFVVLVLLRMHLISMPLLFPFMIG
jgi:hypothetical protein